MIEAVVRYRYRTYPTAKQSKSISRLVGSCGVAFNDAPAYAQANYRAGNRYLGPNAIQKAVLTKAKKRAD